MLELVLSDPIWRGYTQLERIGMAQVAGIDSKLFERAVTGVILLNAAIMGWGLTDEANRELAERLETC
jgi:hypothetical protein